jgi:hypothetical protein
MKPRLALIPVETIQRQILLLRGHKVIPDATLAKLYGVPTKVLLQAVRRNARRFPADFMFALTPEEWASVLRSQSVTSKPSARGGRRYAPLVFTEQGVAMLSSVLRSTRAIEVNIAIMRAFVQLRQLLSTHHDLAAKLAELERKLEGHDAAIGNLFETIRQLLAPDPGHGREMGFHTLMKPAKPPPAAAP